MVDVFVNCIEDVVLLVPKTPEARTWLRANHTRNTIKLWDAQILPRREAVGLLVALQEAGLTIDTI